MKVLLFIHSLACGGAERVTANLANYWATKGWEITIVTLAPATTNFYRLHPTVHCIPLNLTSASESSLQSVVSNVQRIIALRKTLQSVRPDVALAIMTASNVLLAFAAVKLKGLMTVGSEHIYPPAFPVGRVWETLRHLSYRHLDAVSVLTRESADWIRTNIGVNYVSIIPNTAPWPLPSQPPYLSPSDILLTNKHILLAVGRMVEQKGFDLLIAAFALLSPHFPDWILVILGEGPLRSTLEQDVICRGLHGRVLMPGVAGNLGDWYEAAALYVMSSRFEGFGNTLAEAMTYGLPAVSFNCKAGPRDIIRHEVDGLLVPPEDIAALEYALARLMRDESLRRSFAEHAVEARERFSLERIAGMWEQLFDKAKP